MTEEKAAWDEILRLSLEDDNWPIVQDDEKDFLFTFVKSIRKCPKK